MSYPLTPFDGRDPSAPDGYVEDLGDLNMEDQTYDNVGFSFPHQTFANAAFSPIVSTPGLSPHRPVASGEGQRAWLQSILDVLDSGEDQIPEDDDEDEDEQMTAVEIADQSSRTQRLRDILPELDKLWWSKSDFMAEAAEKMADGSRDPRWRVPIGDSGILNLFLAILATPGVPNSLMIHVLRLIGNSCADRDGNRERVVEQNYMSAIISLLNNSSLLPFVIPVLYNICIEYEPAQLKASEANLSKSLIEILSKPSFSEIKSFVSYIYKLLDMLATQSGEMERAPTDLPHVLTETAIDPSVAEDMEDFLGLANCAIEYMKDIRFQEALVKTGNVDRILRFLFFSYTRFEDINPSIDPQSIDEDAKALTMMRSNMNQNLSDISALPDFAATYPVTSPFTANLRRWLSSQRVQLQVCACIILGNIARSDSTCEEFVHKSQIHKPLIAILTSANDSQILHAALGFLKNLALPPANKVILGDAEIINILPRLWQMETLPQIQYSSISLVRQLAIGNFANVRRICFHLSDDPDSPAWERSRLSILTGIFKRSDAEPIKMEIARLITAIVRSFTSPKVRMEADDYEYKRQKFFQRHLDIGIPIGYMVTQTKWPVLRSEGWFAMALMARTPEGADCISDLMHDIRVFQALVETVTGKGLIDTNSSTFESTPAPLVPQLVSPILASASKSDAPARLESIDRENGLILVSELLRQKGSQMASVRSGVFEDLLKGGGAMHLTYGQIREREEFFDARAPLGLATAGGDGSGSGAADNQRREGSGLQEPTEKSGGG